MIPKTKRHRDPKYLKWVKDQTCCICLRRPCDAHHVIGLHWGLSGIGMTAPDSFAMPLCRLHHSQVHQSVDLQQDQPDWLMATLLWAIEDFTGDSQPLLDAIEFIEGRIAA